MFSKKFKKLCAIGLTAVLGMSVLAGCGKGDFNTDADTIVWNLGEDPLTVDPALNTASGAGNLILNAFEGLVRVDEKTEIKPGVAKEWTKSEDGLTYTFKLREDAKWSDGQVVTANDFKYSWLRALDAKTAAEYSYQLFYIKNAEAYNKGKATAEEVGIKVVNEFELEVTLENPTEYFLQLLAFATYQPVRQDMVEAHGEKWARSPETYISNGPFKMVEWKDKEKIVYEKNENYWNAEKVELKKLDVRLVKDITTAYAEFKSGSFDMTNDVPPTEIQAALDAKHAEIFNEFGTYFLAFNIGKNNEKLSPEANAALQNPKFRKALSLAIDRKGLVENITKGGQVPAHSFTPPGIKAPDGTDFDNEKYISESGDIEAAKAMLAEAGYPNGEGLPTFSYLINSEGNHEQIAQYLQDAWSKIGVKIEITKQEFKVFLQTRRDGNYMMSRHGWNGDYVDPYTFLDMWVTGGGNNEIGYSNAEYDALLAKAKVTADATERTEILRQAEKILMDDMVIAPIFYYTKVRAINPAIEGVMVSRLGKVDFIYASKK